MRINRQIVSKTHGMSDNGADNTAVSWYLIPFLNLLERQTKILSRDLEK